MRAQSISLTLFTGSPRLLQNRSGCDLARLDQRRANPRLICGFNFLTKRAEIAGTSVRTLQRELTSAGISYSQIIDRARFRKSTKLLRSSDTKIIDVAMATGYADPAHFTRAFRRMAGVTPREFRSGSEDAGSKTVGDDGTYSTSTRPMRGDHGHNADRRN
jgi:AraC-like DNA-binding protein